MLKKLVTITCASTLLLGLAGNAFASEQEQESYYLSQIKQLSEKKEISPNNTISAEEDELLAKSEVADLSKDSDLGKVKEIKPQFEKPKITLAPQ